MVLFVTFSGATSRVGLYIIGCSQSSQYASVRITEDLPKIGSQRVDRIPQCN